MEKLPIYRFVVGEDDECQLEAMALVDNPAIEMNWQTFYMAEIGPKGGVNKSPKAPKSDTKNKDPKGEGSAKGDASGKKGAKVTAEQEKTLQNKADDFNEKESNIKNGKATLGALKSVFQRGLGAFNTSHSPVVKSAEQWAYARVNAFLYLLKNGRPENAKYDTDFDLLPKKHPKAFSVEVEIIVCENCGHSWDIEDGGDEPYMCKCGYDNTPIIEKFESYNDYPEQASENAKIALRYVEEYGWGDCGEDTGKKRASMLANRENISRDTIARMASFERHRQNSDKKLGDGCGRLMWLCWGGDAGIEWASRKLEQIDKKNKFSFVSDKEKRIISGAFMVADLPIYRRDENEEYYGLFTAEDIYNLRNKFFKQNKSNVVNEMHDSSKMLSGVYMIENFIIDSSRNINAPKGFNLPDGSWFGSYKVDNDEVWNDFIKTGEFKGFSVEGIFKTVKIAEKTKSKIDQMIDIIKQIDN